VADRSYDGDDFRSRLLLHGALLVIPARQNRREPSVHDESAYRSRNKVERLISKRNQFRRGATRYVQTAASFLTFVELAALASGLNTPPTPSDRRVPGTPKRIKVELSPK
jgi:transposase